MKNNLISTHVNGSFAGNYSSIEAVPANKTVCEVFYDGKYPDSFFDGEKWVENLPTPEEIAEANKTPVPFSVQNIQIRKALIKFGIMPSDISTMLNSLPSETFEQKIKRELLINMWEYENEIIRMSPYIITSGAGLGFNSEKLDELFILANTL